MDLTNDQIKAGIIAKDRAVLVHVYDKHLPLIERMVVKNSGQRDQALDVFQEGLVVLFEKLSGMKDHSKIIFGAYLHGVCRIIWLKKLKEVQTVNMDNVDYSIASDNGEAFEEMILMSNRYELYRLHFDRLGDDCKRILKHFFAKKSLKEIAGLMGYSDSYAKKKKHLCQKTLIGSIQADETFDTLTPSQISE